MIIKLYDNEGYDYPLIKVKKEDLETFKNVLKEYQKYDDYTFEGFVDLIEERGLGEFLSNSYDEVVYF